MSEYRKVSTALWSSPDFQALGPPPACLSSLWQYLLVSPAMRMVPGLLFAGPARIAEDIDPELTTWTPAKVAGLLDDLEARGMLRWDRASRVVWLVNALGRTEHAPNDNQVKGWRSVFDEVPRSCPFRGALWDAMERAAGSKAEHLGEAPELPSEPMPNPSGTVPDSVSVSVTPAVAVAAAVEGDACSRTPPRAKPADLAPFVDAWNRGLDEAAEDLGRAPNVKRAVAGRVPAALRKAVKAHPDPDAWRWAAYALATSWKATRSEAFDGFGFAWVANLSAKRLTEHIEAGVEARERGRGPVTVRGGNRQLAQEDRNAQVLDDFNFGGGAVIEAEVVT